MFFSTGMQSEAQSASQQEDLNQLCVLAVPSCQKDHASGRTANIVKYDGGFRAWAATCSEP